MVSRRGPGQKPRRIASAGEILYTLPPIRAVPGAAACLQAPHLPGPPPRIITRTMKRVIVFLDYSNFHQALYKLTGGQFPESRKFDFKGFVDTLTQGMDLIKVYFVCSSSAGSGSGLQRFYDWLDSQDFFLVKQFERRANDQGEQREKQVDVYIATQMVALAYENAYDVAMIVSGDEDYVPAIEIIQQKGKIAVAVSCASMLSDLLRKKADRSIFIDADGAIHYQNFLN
jgi:uncharacterized LabA/DUF88 family protein